MNELKKKRIKAVMKYTWPFYIIAALIVVFTLNLIFRVAHPIPLYKSLTLFISGEVTDEGKLKKDLLNEFDAKELKSVSFLYDNPGNANYGPKLSVAGYNTADILILPLSKMDELKLEDFALELTNELVTSHYSSYALYMKNDVNYGVKIDKEKVKDYMKLPEQDCYMLLNARSENTGKYSPKKVEEHDMALTLVKDWGSNV